MKIYTISGLGADEKVLSKLHFPSKYEVVNLPWKIPERNETWESYLKRFELQIPENEGEFCLLGYSFGGIIVQELHRKKPAKKTVILGSIRCSNEKSKLMRITYATKMHRRFPESMFTEKSAVAYAFFRKFLAPGNPKLFEYFRVRDPYYLKWSVEKIVEWNFQPLPGIIQIMAEKDIVFPIKNCRPDYVVNGATHLFPVTHAREVSKILNEIFE